MKKSEMIDLLVDPILIEKVKNQYFLTPSHTKWLIGRVIDEFKEYEIKEDWTTFQSETRDERNEEKEGEEGEFVPPFKEWFEHTYEYLPTIDEYFKKNIDEFKIRFKDYILQIINIDDYFDEDEDGE